MGTIFRVTHQDQVRVLKILHPHLAAIPEYRDRFLQEAELSKRLEHPGFVRTHGLLEEGEQIGLIMDFVEGRPLSEIIGTETGPIPWERCWPLFHQLLEAVGAAHAQGVIHRDLKPENILVDGRGRLTLLDFGIAKDLRAAKTRTGMVMGTVDYMAPEQFVDAKRVDLRVDIYALGMTLYEMLAGRLPWSRDATEFQVLQQKTQGKIPPPTDFYPDIPGPVLSALRKATRQAPSKRFSSVGAFTRALQVSQQDTRVSGWEGKDALWKPIALGGLGLLGLAAMSWVMSQGKEAPPVEELAVQETLPEDTGDTAARPASPSPPSPPARPSPPPREPLEWKPVPPSNPLPLPPEDLPIELPPPEVMPGLIYDQGRANEEAGELQRASELYRIALELEPEKGLYMLALGRVLGELGQESESVSLLLAAMEKGEIEAAWLLGYYYEETLGQPDRALFYYEACAAKESAYQEVCQEQLEIYGVTETETQDEGN
jgi:serine/threonine-protein kinase